VQDVDVLVTNQKSVSSQLPALDGKEGHVPRACSEPMPWDHLAPFCGFVAPRTPVLLHPECWF
jgi:hypothetical protein